MPIHSRHKNSTTF